MGLPRTGSSTDIARRELGLSNADLASPEDELTLGKLRLLLELFPALANAIDLARPGWSTQTSIIFALGIRVGRRIGLSHSQLAALSCCLLLRDLTFPSNAGNPSRPCACGGGFCQEPSRDPYPFSAEAHVPALATNKNGVEQSALRTKSRVFDPASIFSFAQKSDHAGERIARILGLRETVVDSIHDSSHWLDHSLRLTPQRERPADLFTQICSLAVMLEHEWRFYGQEAASVATELSPDRTFNAGLISAVRDLRETGQLWTDLSGTGLRPGNVILGTADYSAFTWTAVKLDKACNVLAEVIHAKSHLLYTHSLRVSNLAGTIASCMCFSDEDICSLRRAAVLHDIGKVGTPDSILVRPSELDEDDWKAVHQHPEHTYQIVRCIPSFESIAELAAQHHENLDGSGYPNHLTSERISMLSRILAVSDRYNALSEQRPYRQRLSPSQVLEMLTSEAPHRLDGACLATLKHVLRNRQQSRLVHHTAASTTDTDELSSRK